MTDSLLLPLTLGIHDYRNKSAKLSEKNPLNCLKTNPLNCLKIESGYEPGYEANDVINAYIYIPSIVWSDFETYSVIQQKPDVRC